ncbi:hypothetical protein EOM75_08080 [Candidatus Falkowbacteria bacterium]|jgi:hypothetical protein|nr:hypothetical protein [Candidatus Falkowbacteria bacterium]
MKHFKPITTILAALLISGAAIFYSCSKQETEIQSNDTETVQMTQADINFQNQLMHFKDKLDYQHENPGYKSVEMLSVDSAVYLMKALFNYTYGYPDENYDRTKADTATITLQLQESGEVSLNEINLKYSELTEIVRTLYYNSGFDNKGLVLTSLDIGKIESDQVELEVYAVTGNIGSDNYPFNEGDDWWYGYDMGKCDNSPGSDTTDAAELIQNNISINYILPPPPSGYRYIYVPDTPITLEGNEYHNPDSPYPDDNYTDYLMYYAIAEADSLLTDEIKCLEHEEMNFYVEGGMEIATSKLPETNNKPSNWLFMSCDYYDMTDSDELENARVRHEAIFNFAYRYLTPLPEDPRSTL